MSEKESKSSGIHKTPTPKYVASNCESCEFYDFDEDYDAYVCIMDLDQDDMQNFIAGTTAHCPYYRYYDEYKSVHKQI